MIASTPARVSVMVRRHLPVDGCRESCNDTRAAAAPFDVSAGMGSRRETRGGKLPEAAEDPPPAGGIRTGKNSLS